MSSIDVIPLLEADPALATELLVAANSPGSAFCSKIFSVMDAVAALGLDSAVGIAWRLAAWSIRDDRFDPAMVRACWTHSIATASIASRLGHAYGVPEAIARSLGLLHDVGRLGLLVAWPADYAARMLCCFESVDEVLEVERRTFGMDHCLVGSTLAFDWRLPQLFHKIAGSHHEWTATAATGPASLVAAACRLSDAIGYPAVAYPVRASQEKDWATGDVATQHVEDLEELRLSARQLIRKWDAACSH